jgi:hypothetical protein
MKLGILLATAIIALMAGMAGYNIAQFAFGPEECINAGEQN